MDGRLQAWTAESNNRCRSRQNTHARAHMCTGIKRNERERESATEGVNVHVAVNFNTAIGVNLSHGLTQ